MEEMKKIKQDAVMVYDGGPNKLVGYQQITGHIIFDVKLGENFRRKASCLLYTSPSPRDGLLSRMPSSA